MTYGKCVDPKLLVAALRYLVSLPMDKESTCVPLPLPSGLEPIVIGLRTECQRSRENIHPGMLQCQNMNKLPHVMQKTQCAKATGDPSLPKGVQLLTCMAIILL